MRAFRDVQIQDVTRPVEVFCRASRWLRDHRQRAHHVYQVEIIGPKRGASRTSPGLRLHADPGFAEVGRGLDVLLIA